MIYRWFYIDDHCRVQSLGPMSMQKAREHEEKEARFLMTVEGLDMLREQINTLLRDPKNRKQLERNEDD